MGGDSAPGTNEIPEGPAAHLSTADLIRAALFPGAGHLYLSTACLHHSHPECRTTCKYCGVTCICTCHPLVPWYFPEEYR